MTELEQHLQSIPHTLAMNPQAQALRSLLEAVVVARNSRDAIAALGLLQKVSVNNSSPVTTHLEFITHLACGFLLVTSDVASRELLHSRIVFDFRMIWRLRQRLNCPCR